MWNEYSPASPSWSFMPSSARPSSLSTRRRSSSSRFSEQSKLTRDSADNDLSSYSFHMADQGTDAMEREKAFLFASQEGRYLWHVNQALRRLFQAPEKFGKCEQCGEEIGFERLDALPHARLCIKCKAKEEDGKRR